MKVVVDASSALLMLTAPDRIAPSLMNATELLAPDLIVAEVLNARWKIARARVTAPTLDNLLGLFARLRLLEGLAYAADAAALAERLDYPIYGCLYATIARRQTAQLVTADRRFANKLAGGAVDVVLV